MFSTVFLCAHDRRRLVTHAVTHSCVPKLTDAAILSIAGKCPITRLSLGCLERITDHAIIAMSCCNLLMLDVQGCYYNLRDPSIVAVAKHCPRLKSIDVGWW